MKEVDLQPEVATIPDQIAIDETVSRVNGRKDWLYAAVYPDSNTILNVWLFQARTTERPLLVLREL